MSEHLPSTVQMPVTDYKESPASRLVISLTLSLIACSIIGFVTTSGGLQGFDAFGVAKKYGLPVTYLIFLLAIFIPYGRGYPRAFMPLWWIVLLVIFMASTFFSLVIPRQVIGHLNLAQGIALISGLLLVSWAGLLAPQWSEKEKSTLLYVLGGAGFAASVFDGVATLYGGAFDVTLGPFVTVPVPAAFGLIYAGFRSRKHRIPFLLLGSAILIALIISLQDEVEVSISEATQFIVCLFVLLALIFQKFFRQILVATVTAVVVVVFFQSALPSLMLGKIPEGLTDVTLTHRAYEAAAVNDLVESNAVTVLLGLGPSATVNLVASPDAETLSGVGREMGAVDDVHFLASWVLMKLGALGLIWLLMFYFAIFAQLARLFRQPRPNVFDSFLVMFVVAGAISGIPAATNLFANPLPALFLGILIARSRLTTEPMSVDRALAALPQNEVTASTERS